MSPATTTALRLGVFGGTFDPIHAAHLALARAAREALALDRVLFVPAGDPWRRGGRVVATAADRLAMTIAAVEHEPAWSVADLEVRRRGPSHTVDTLTHLRAQGYRRLWFILGSDALQDLPHWHDPGHLLGLCRLAVAHRPGYALDAAALEELLPGLSRVVDWVPMEPMAISATDLRARLATGEDLVGLVPAPVLAYVREHGLYGSAPHPAGWPAAAASG